MKYNNKRKNNSGISLTEVVVAIFLIAISIGAVMNLVVQSINLERSREYSYIAMNIAKSRIEEMRQARKDISFEILQDYEETAWTPINKYGESDSTGEFGRKTDVSVPTGEENLKHVTVVVRYKLVGVWRPTAIQLDTYISSYY